VPIFFYRAGGAGINQAVQVIEKPARFDTFQHLQRFEEMISLVGAAVPGEYFRRRAGQLTSGLILVASAKAAFASPISPPKTECPNQYAGIVPAALAYPMRGIHHARLCRWWEYPRKPKLEEFPCETDTARRCAGGNDRNRGSDHRPLGPG
jgi:hypothetical protein